MRQFRIGPCRKTGLESRLTTGTVILAGLLAIFGAFYGSVAAASQPPITENQITGIAYGNSPAQARRMALSQVVYQLNQKISYNRCHRATAHTKPVDCTSLAYYFDFPLEGIRYESIPAEVGQFGQRATLTRDAVVSQFRGQLPQLEQEITTALTHAGQSADSLQSLWEARDALMAYSEILALFGVDTDHSLTDQQARAIADLERSSAQTLTSLDQLPESILALGDVQNAFIHAPVPEGSVEMTPFSDRVRRALSEGLAARFPQADIKLRGVPSRGLVRVKPCYDPLRKVETNCASASEPEREGNSAGGESLLLGEYTQTDDSVLLKYKLLDGQTGQSRTAFFRIPGTAVEGIRTAPIHRPFDQTLHQNILGDEQFRVQLESSRGSRNILIYEKEEIGLKVRASQAAYFYIVGHVIRQDRQYSYLVELDPANGTFVGEIGADQANRWVEIGEFTVEPPLGVEHLQLIAANYDLSASLPPTRWDETLGYHVIKGSENDAMAGLQTVRGLQRVCAAATTRGLQRNCAATAKIEADSDEDPLFEHETVLSYTSLPEAPAASPER